MCARVSKQIGVLKRLKNLIPATIPHLTYCYFVWHFSCSCDWQKLERLQERALRAVFNNSSNSYGKLLQKAK